MIAHHLGLNSPSFKKDFSYINNYLVMLKVENDTSLSHGSSTNKYLTFEMYVYKDKKLPVNGAIV